MTVKVTPWADAAEEILIASVLFDESFAKAHRQALSSRLVAGTEARSILAHAVRSIEEHGVCCYKTVLEAVAREFGWSREATNTLAAELYAVALVLRPGNRREALAVLAERRAEIDARSSVARLAADIEGGTFSSIEITGQVDDLAHELRGNAPSVATPLIEGFDDPADVPTELLPTGLEFFDRAMPYGAPALGELLVFAAPPKLGKSALGLYVAIAVLTSNPDATALWCRGEMSRRKLQLRALQATSGLASIVLERDPASLSPEQARRRSEGLESLHAVLPRLIDLAGPFTVSQIAAAAARHEPKLIVVDYLQKVRPSQEGRARREEVDEVSRQLSELAVESNAVVIVISNMSKSAATSHPTIADAFKESGSIGYDADAGYVGELLSEDDAKAFAAGDDLPEKYAIRWRCVGNRNGPARSIDCVFDRFAQRFYGIAQEGRR